MISVSCETEWFTGRELFKKCQELNVDVSLKRIYDTAPHTSMKYHRKLTGTEEDIMMIMMIFPDLKFKKIDHHD